MTDYSFPRQARLLDSRDYKRVFDDVVVKAADRTLLILARPNEVARPRLGLVIAKKHVRRANQRNRVKRVIRESFRLNQSRLDALDLVIIARQGLAEQDNEELQKLMTKLWQRLKRKAAALSEGKQS
ncbi:ribonuclease P [Pokkaliibacter plantistimulans]|uniref:Ribonuclease P protein component n=2 Tax=Pseudomonadota TaxID=1224 RepID=A0ABX5LXK1_9GAMM|nr:MULTISPECIES: ribonuclease P protein component [Pokkaliibacter]MDH2433145.1 ribonuclease P protein component [Pokkaliibacter sp. MBI-7]PPC78070.1 ribonuclease P protein component [Pokkaliibacter plantistimulans]PXF30917.1 ribonuclease P [Pokkaliibacter plantistimulans]